MGRLGLAVPAARGDAGRHPVAGRGWRQGGHPFLWVTVPLLRQTRGYGAVCRGGSSTALYTFPAQSCPG